ncbi:hypothetical protein EKO27_g991 [Xylaria grammica]|uniref:Bulb-type lectin domain-containing protein n=1 Tax=Xylaria grammica TaxID=363999 RepID=A0A439DIE8_9PEZI|nr:hypothetical protein EKO27_g991 [Xylaria grammica]
MALKSSFISALAGLGAYASTVPHAPADKLPARHLTPRDGVNGDFASFSKGWSMCAGTVAALSSGTHLEFQSDGNLVMYTATQGPSFYSGYSDAGLPCANACNCRIIFQEDGNLVTYINYGQPNQVATWSTNTAGVIPKTGTEAMYFQIYGQDIAVNNFPFIAIVDAYSQGLYSGELHLPGDPVWCRPGQSSTDCGLGGT